MIFSQLHPRKQLLSVFVAIDTDFPLIANRHVVLLKRVVELKGGLLTYLIGKHEDVVVLELEGVVIALVILIGLMRCLILPHILGNILGNVQRKRKVLVVIIKNVHHLSCFTSKNQIQKTRVLDSHTGIRII